MKTIVWVFGSSAVGKETFIKKFIEKPMVHIVQALNLENTTFAYSPESVEYIAQFDNDPIVDKRIEIIERVRNIYDTSGNFCIFIKGQDSDLEKNLTQEVQSNFLDARCCIVYLDTSIDEIYLRVRRHSWWTAEDELGGKPMLQEWLDNQKRMLRKLQGFEFIVLDSSNFEYNFIKELEL